IDVGVSGAENDVAAVPAERVHLRARGGKDGRGAEPLGPVLAPGEQRPGNQIGRDGNEAGSTSSYALNCSGHEAPSDTTPPCLWHAATHGAVGAAAISTLGVGPAGDPA